MRLVILAPAMLVCASALAAAPPSASPSACRDNPTRHLADTKGKFRKLNQLPRAEVYAAVYRRGADGCIVPILYRDRNAPPTSAPRRP